MQRKTWLGKSISNSQISLKEFHLFRQDRNTTKKGGGLCIYAHKCLTIDPNCHSHLNICNNHIELQIIKLILPQTKPILVLNTYRPPSGKVQHALDILNDTLHALPNNAEIYLLGDLNIDISQKSSSLSQKLKLFGKTNKLKQFIDSPTRFTQK